VEEFLNIAAYKFVELEAQELADLRQRLKEDCESQEFRGTILLSTEGINVSLAGLTARVRGFQRRLAGDGRFRDLVYKESYSSHRPFNRMLVKVKKEIIAFGVPGVSPGRSTAPYIQPQDLKRWLDEGKEVTLVDTRNDYEIALGTFRDCRSLGINEFRSFPDNVDALGDLDPQRPVVTFCTGGIRCEKASALLLERGFRDVYQLHGGILKYFEECGGAHYAGDCFVYDRRVALNERLEETRTVQCFNCLMPVTHEEQQLESYVPDVSCQRCIDGKPQPQPPIESSGDPH
jgi:predicted sulfurtransferase